MALLVALAGHKEQFVEIAAYTAGTGGTSIAAVMLSGGTTLRYVTGSEDERSIVYAFRRKFVFPLLVIAGIAISGVYGHGAGLPISGVLAGGIASVFANHFELSGGDLQRGGRIATWGTLIIAPRLIAVAALVVGFNFAWAMLGAQATTAAAGWLLTHRIKNGLPSLAPPSRSLWRLAHTRDHTALALSSAIILRLPFIVGPLIATSKVAGQFAVLVSAQQAATSALIAGLYTTMAMRARGATGATVFAERLHRQERLFVSLGFIGGLIVSPFGLYVGKGLGLPHAPHIQLWWALLALGVAPMVWNRAVQFRLLSDGRTTESSRLVITVMTFSVVAAVVAFGVQSMLVLAALSLIGEGGQILLRSIKHNSRARRRTRPMGQAE